MRSQFQKSVIHFLTKPVRFVLKWYLSKSRNFTYQGITVTVWPGVFHPGFFHSTKFLLGFLENQPVHGKQFLELGCGSGLISIFAARKGALVTASDINPKAVENTHINAKQNQVDVLTIHSDLFDELPQKKWDWIVINPPYYPQSPKTEAEYAWYCGQEYQYFEKLFTGLSGILRPEMRVLMVLSEVCDLDRIFSVAHKYQVTFEKIAEKKVWIDGSNFLYWIQKKS
jgi:release factor glutamine methyltransferase